MGIEQILEEFERLIDDSSRVPFTSKRMVEEDELSLIIDRLKMSIPASIQKARQLISENQKVLEDAQNQAAQMIEEAKERAESIREGAREEARALTSEQEVYRTAVEESGFLLERTKKQAKELYLKAEEDAEQRRVESESFATELKKEAEEYANKIYNDSTEYADNVLLYLTNKIGETHESVKNAHVSLRATFKNSVNDNA